MNDRAITPLDPSAIRSFDTSTEEGREEFVAHRIDWFLRHKWPIGSVIDAIAHHGYQLVPADSRHDPDVCFKLVRRPPDN